MTTQVSLPCHCQWQLMSLCCPPCNTSAPATRLAMNLFLLLSLTLGALGLSKRIVGGHEPVNTSDPDILAIAQKIATEFDKTSTSLTKSGVKGVVEGTKQVVAGMSYDLTVELADTACDKASKDPCSPIAGAPTTRVTANVWVQPWRDFAQVTISDRAL